MGDINLDQLKEIYKKTYDEKCKHYENIAEKHELPATERIIVMGDLHGDMQETIKSLKLAGLVKYNSKKNSVKWTGGNTVLVQVGDQIDRCRQQPCSIPSNNDENSDIRILKLFTELHTQATKEGGAVYSVIGNHEVMNVDGRMDYVSYKNYSTFEGDKNNQEFLSNLPENLKGMDARKWVFKPGNPIANFLACTRKMSLKIGDSLFVHAGILPEISQKYKISDLNTILSLYLTNNLTEIEKYTDVLGPDAARGTLIKNSETCEGRECFNISPLWNRQLGNINGSVESCNNLLDPVFEKYGVKRMIIGHTPQLTSGINSKCDDRLWFVDYGSSKAFDVADINVSLNNQRSETRNSQVLEILNDTQVRVLK